MNTENFNTIETIKARINELEAVINRPVYSERLRGLHQVNHKYIAELVELKAKLEIMQAAEIAVAEDSAVKAAVKPSRANVVQKEEVKTEVVDEPEKDNQE